MNDFIYLWGPEISFAIHFFHFGPQHRGKVIHSRPWIEKLSVTSMRHHRGRVSDDL